MRLKDKARIFLLGVLLGGCGNVDNNPHVLVDAHEEVADNYQLILEYQICDDRSALSPDDSVRLFLVNNFQRDYVELLIDGQVILRDTLSSAGRNFAKQIFVPSDSLIHEVSIRINNSQELHWDMPLAFKNVYVFHSAEKRKMELLIDDEEFTRLD